MEKKYFINIILIILGILLFFLKKSDKDDYEVYKNNNELYFTNYFWLKKFENENSILMSYEDIQKYNNSLDITKIDVNGTLLNSIVDFPEYIDKNYLLTLLKYNLLNESSNKVDEILFRNTIKIAVNNLFNIENLQDKIKIGYGINIKKTDIKFIPSNKKSFSSGDKGKNFDNFQERCTVFGEPLVILHYNKDKTWAFVITKSKDKGWIPIETIAITNKENFINYVNDTNFLLVIDKNIIIDDSLIVMGSKLLLNQENDDNYIIKFPIRNSIGELEFIEKNIPKTNSIFKGYLPYTKKNIVKQIMKFYGEKYTWGDLDCSGVLYYTYNCFGFNMLRNSNKQVKIGQNKEINNYFFINKVLDRVETTSFLQIQGHIMLYLGKIDNKYYFIHSSGTYLKNNKKFFAMEVKIDNLDLKKFSNKKTYKKSLKNIVFVGKNN